MTSPQVTSRSPSAFVMISLRTRSMVRRFAALNDFFLPRVSVADRLNVLPLTNLRTVVKSGGACRRRPRSVDNRLWI